MSKTDMLKVGEYMPTEVGLSLYVWSAGGATPGAGRACVITSHGMDMDALPNSAEDRPQVPLYFYAPHGMALPDNGARGPMTRATKWYERVAAGAAMHDYVLTKAQGYHSAKSRESYSQLQVGFHAKGQQEYFDQSLLEVLAGIKNGPLAEIHRAAAQQQYQANVAQIKEVVLDVVTIRHRRGLAYRQVTLFSAIKQLERAGFHYSAVHCYFCRGATSGHKMANNTGVGD